MRIALVVAGLFAVCQVSPLSAQWHIGLGVGRDVYSGVSQGDFEDGSGSFRPYRPLVWSLRVEGHVSQPRLSVTFRYATPDIALVGEDLTLIPQGSFLEMAGAALTAGWTLIQLTPGVTIEGEAGPTIERWRVEDADDRTLLGVTGNLAIRIDLGGRFSARLSARMGMTPKSPLAGALIEGYTPRAGWRRGLEAGVLLSL